MEALHALTQERVLLHKIAEQLKSTPLSASDRLEVVLAELKEAQRELATVQAAQLSLKIPQLLESLIATDKYSIVATEVTNVPNVEALRDLALKVRDQLDSQAAVVALSAVIDSKPAVIVVCNSKAQGLGAKAGDLVKIASQVLGGGGGGKPDIAQGGGTDVSKIGAALVAITESLR